LERSDLIDAVAKFANRAAPAPESISELVQSRRPIFLANRWSDLEKMRVALAVQDFQAIQKIGHNCKGIGKGYGFPQISEIGASIQSAARAQDLSLTKQAISSFEGCLEAASKEAA
jgi:HPt (histidine-containing phosphotransfer) domain-containing protein